MNKLIRNAAAILTAGIVAATGLSATGFAANEEYTASYTAAYAATVAKPSYSVKGAKGYRYIKLSTDTSGATIYYTTNGKTPTTKSTKYKSGTLLKISKNVQIKAIAVKGSSKSAVMTKTFKVGTVLGDVTGNGKIDTNDYNRLKNYINGKTSYICKDNADVNGSGTITSKDLSLLKQYINGDIKKFPTSDDEEVTASLSVTPKITVYKTYGGKKIELTCSDKDVTLYYTINGKTPSKSTLKYTDKFIVDEDTTIKCVAYKSGKYSKVVTREVEVDQCKSVETDTSTSKTYDDSIKIKLSCATPDSKIYYTTNGADPRSYGSLYTGAIELTEDTTVKAYSRAKGYADSAVKTFEYKVDSKTFTLSGVVWDDTPNATSIPDGIKQSNESGINGISVSVLNVDKNTYEGSTTTATINGVAGSYKFENLKEGTKYKVVFKFNGQKYRAYNYTVSGGNQAISSSFADITIKKDGAYSNNGSKISSVVNYSYAINSSDYEAAATSNVYTKAADNVNLALNTKVYGDMKLNFTPVLIKKPNGKTTSVTSNGQTASNDDVITYELTLTNNSYTQTLSDASIRIFIDEDLQLDSITSSSGYRVNYSLAGSTSGYKVYDLSGFIGSGLVKGSSVRLTVTARVNSSIGATIANYAEVTSYKYSGSCYDKSSVPGNMSNFSVRESDEAKTVDIKVVEATTDTDKSLSCNTTSLILEANGTQKYKVVVENGTAGLDDVIIDNGGSSAFDYVTSYERFDKTTVIEITVIGKAEGSGSIKVYLKDDTKQVVTTTIYVKPAPVTSTPTPDTPVSI
ncbi:MAG: FN3 associated domain-containing protein [Ruminiclostridium sp.]